MDAKQIAKAIDHTNLKPELDRDGIKAMIAQCKQYNFGGLCVTPAWVYFAKQKLAGTETKVVTVPNWLPGGGLRRIKGDYVFAEADEVDYIWDITLFAAEKKWANTAEELAIIRKQTKGKMKVIIETTAIRALALQAKVDYEMLIKEACKLVDESGSDYIKTDSGLFIRRGGFAQLKEDAQLLVKYSKLPVKASAGIRSLQEVQFLLASGVAKIGTSSGVQIMQEVLNEQSIPKMQEVQGVPGY